MHDCRSKRWSGTNRTAPLHPASNQLLSCWKLACLPTCLLAVFNRTCALVHIVGISVIITANHHHQHHRVPTSMARCRPKCVALPLARADVKAASCLDRMSSASETDVQIYMWYYGTKMSDDISPLRSMYVLGSGHSPDHHRRIRWVAEDLFTCLPEQQPIYTCISA